MGLRYENLDEITRGHMLQEAQAAGHYLSPRLSPVGRALWVSVLEHALRDFDDDWLARQLEDRGMLSPREAYVLNGRTRYRNIPNNAAQSLAEGEFNRFYLRGLCLRAQAEGIAELEVYRGKGVREPRPESEMMIGRLIPVGLLLDDLRVHSFVEPALGVPGGPNSGITCRLPG